MRLNETRPALHWQGNRTNEHGLPAGQCLRWFPRAIARLRLWHDYDGVAVLLMPSYARLPARNGTMLM